MMRYLRNSTAWLVSASSKLISVKAKKGRPVAYLIAYLIGMVAAFGLIRLVDAPDWVGVISVVGSLVGGVLTSVIEKKLNDPNSIPVAHLVTTALIGAMTVGFLATVHYWQAQRADLDALVHIKPSGNINMDAGDSAEFRVNVPAHRDYLTIKFAVTANPGSIENCSNGASLSIVQKYAATVGQPLTVDSSTNYTGTIEIPSRVDRFTLSVTFIPQLGFDICANDITVVSADFHNRLKGCLQCKLVE